MTRKFQSTLEKVEKLGVTSAIDSPLEDESLYKEDVSYALFTSIMKPKICPDVVTDIRDASGMKQALR